MKEIRLTRDKVSVVDDDMYDYLSQWKWYASYERYTWYAKRMISVPKRNSIGMHRVIAQAEKGQYVDHKNGDGLDNRRENLRICTNGENLLNRGATSKNTSGYKGVGWVRHLNKWRARIMIDQKETHLGVFETAEDAARAYDEAALSIFGEFAWLNFPNSRR